AGADWPQFRGINHDGISPDRIITNWTGAVTNPVWRIPLTNALCSLVVSGGKVYTQTIRPVQGVPREICVALSATNGAELWATSLDNASYPSGGVGYDDGPRSTPAVADGGIFVLTSYLKLYRLNPTNGAVVWQKDLQSLYGAVVIAWQNAASPLIANGLIYLNASTSSNSLMALRTTDGSLVWRAQNAGLTHSTPVLATIHGVPQVIFATQQGVISVDPNNGTLFWRATYPFSYSTSIGASPVVWDDVVFVTGARAYGMGSVAYQASLSNNVWTASRLWWTNTTAAHWMTPVCLDGYLYGQFGIFSFDGPNAQLTCLDIRTGVVKWQIPGFGRGGTVLVNNQIVTLTENGQLLLVKADTNSYVELGRFQAILNYFPDNNKCWNAPAVSDGKVFARSSSFVAAFDLSVPALKLEPPQFVGADKLALTIEAVNGAPLASNRVAAMEVLAGTNLVESFSQWAKLTNGLALTNGRVRMDNVDSSGHSRRYFIVREPN
ncbi:MAG TPA: PQQ-binding-like beta-propeller repeat protein, partial [Candidatus Binatia bacterium]|nr:PQQ-binding-like beta-propeller repeat protein [Candidatus Binatia bacterium]